MKNVCIVDQAKYLTTLRDELVEDYNLEVELVDVEDSRHCPKRDRYDLLVIEPYFLYDYRVTKVVKTIETLIQQARENSSPIIALSSQDQESLERHNIRLGVQYDFFLQKPERTEVILKEITSRLGI